MRPTDSTPQSQLQPNHLKDCLGSGTQIRLVDSVGESGWDSLLMSHPNSSFFHGNAWAQVLRDAYGFRPCYLVVQQDKHLAALLPVMEARSWLNGVRGVSLPFTDECAPLTTPAVETATLIKTVLEHGKTNDWRYWELRGGAEAGLSLPPSVEFHGHRLCLRHSIDTLFQRLEGAVRRAIKKAERSNVKVEFSQSTAALRSFYMLHYSTRKKHGIPPQPNVFFECIDRHILNKGSGFVAIATYEQKPIAGAVFFHLGSKVIYKFGASNEQFQHLRASNLVIWESIKQLVANGFTELNFGKTSLCNEGLRRFKLGWGAEESRLLYARYDFKKARFVEDHDPAHAWYNRVFQQLPLPLLGLIGRLFYKHVV